MKGDFTRNTFSSQTHYSQVLMQQGRVQLDADWNEQGAISQHYLRRLARDLIGPYGGPVHNCGFSLTGNPAHLGRPERDLLQQQHLLPLSPGDFFIRPGIYYVQGIMCESEHVALFSRQPDFTQDALKAGDTQSFLVYLDVWEQHLTSLEVPGLREVALGGPDTASRAKVVWQVKTLGLRGPEILTSPGESLYPALYLERELRRDKIYFQDEPGGNADHIQELEARISSYNNPRLCARVNETATGSGPMSNQAGTRYRGLENQLYRVEIHRPGPAGTATFKWSRDNGAIAFLATDLGKSSGRSSGASSRTVVTLDHLDQAGTYSLKVGDWVEVVRASDAVGCAPGSLVQVQSVDFPNLSVTLEGNMPPDDGSAYTLLRRWDQAATATTTLDNGAVPLVEGNWLDLEDGVQVHFEGSANGAESPYYSTSDYWLIPARVATGNVEWPVADGQPAFLEAQGVTHYYAPLAILGLDNNSQIGEITDLRRAFQPLSQPIIQQSPLG